MTEKEFRTFIEKRVYLSRVKIEDIIVESSDAQFLKRTLERGEKIIEEQAKRIASLIRKNVATSIAMYESGVATKKEVLEHRFEKLPEDFPS